MFARTLIPKVLTGGAVAALAVALLASQPPERLEAASVTVRSSADAGPGTFRAAIEQANNDAGINVIRFQNLTPITLESVVEYTGTQALTVQGTFNIVIQGAAAVAAPIEADCDPLFLSSGGADLTIKNITFQDSDCHGVVVDVPASATGDIEVTLDRSGIRNTLGHGLHIDDLDGSSAAISLELRFATIEAAGLDPADYDGIRVDERGEGGVTAGVQLTQFTGTGGDGLEIDEGGPGAVLLDVSVSGFNNNGFANDEDREDGVDVDEAGEGGIDARLNIITASGNGDEGIDLNETNGGDVLVRATRIVANENGVEFGSDGIGIEERDGGRVDARFTHLTADGNGDNGIDIKEDENEEDAEEESDSGDLLVRMTLVSTSSNLDHGLNIEEFSDGNLDFQATGLHTDDNGGDGGQVQEEGAGANDTRFVLTSADRNGDEGWQIEEAGEGDLESRFVNSTVNENDDHGIQAEQSGGGTGELRLTNTAVDGNGDDALDLSGVDLV